jgi:hypothetical protein
MLECDRPDLDGDEELVVGARVHLRFSLGKRQAPAYSVMLGAAPVTVS